MCVVRVKYCNHLLAVCMAGVDYCLCVDGKMSKGIGMGIRKGTVVSFVPTLLVAFWGIHPYISVHFFKCFFVICFS